MGSAAHGLAPTSPSALAALFALTLPPPLPTPLRPLLPPRLLPPPPWLPPPWLPPALLA
jgi:hypothetical protein